MDSSTNSDIEAELDELSVRVLELMNQFIVCKVNIENYVRSGCIDLAKARYINGNRSISALQLPTEDALGVQAKFKVSPEEVEGKPNFQRYQSAENLNLDDKGLSSSFKSIDLNSPDDKSKRFSNDPLKWFGFLVPQSLRQSKSTFEKCLEIVVENVNVQLELQHSIQRYKELRNSLE
ncbi:coiled-coil domain-containing protein 115 [Planococcus citri]|uniref:coiled-coil domain-containing protein 115 n=1 Tax=Planococcus citri TaxID=170843 RepID=UPI0031F84C06